MVEPPIRLMARRPIAPSEPVPERTIANVRCLKLAANDFEQQIGGGANEMDQLGPRQRERGVGVHEQMSIGRRQKDGAGPQSFALLRFFHEQLRRPAEYTGEQAGMTRIEMLNDDDRRGEIGRQRREERR